MVIYLGPHLRWVAWSAFDWSADRPSYLKAACPMHRNPSRLVVQSTRAGTGADLLARGKVPAPPLPPPPRPHPSYHTINSIIVYSGGFLQPHLLIRSLSSCLLPDLSYRTAAAAAAAKYHYPLSGTFGSPQSQVYGGYVTGIMGDEDNPQEERLDSVCEILSAAAEEV